MSNLSFTLEDVNFAIGLIIACITLLVFIFKGIKPITEMTKKLDNDFEKLGTHEKRLDKIDNDISEIKSMLKLLCVQNISTMNHMIDGNGIEEMKKTRDEAMKMLSQEDKS